MTPPPDFAEALLVADRPIVMEIKRKGGDGRDLLGGRTVREATRCYEDLGAACLSVVTGSWFGGDVAMLDEVRAATSLPVLQKDFITRRSQLDAAARRGAQAVLLTVGLVSPAAVGRLIDHALERGLTPFVEVSGRDELGVISHADRAVVAVNNKDIGRRERGPADLTRSHGLLGDLLDAGVRCPVSASGIESPAAAAALLDAGFRGLLVGTALLTASDPAAWLHDVDRERASAARTVAQRT